MDYTREQLETELKALSAKEEQLARVQRSRRKKSKLQAALWVGIGRGDGLEATEIAKIRGEKEAIMRALEKMDLEKS